MKRWLLWTFRCQRGRRCARLVGKIIGADLLPENVQLTVTYVCDGCGTTYSHLLEYEYDELELPVH